ncbi:MAG: AMP-binding protein [Planctomycetes bacterium]|nr:AMP-binding protein [Planctomycetota bacterium]
MPSTLIDIGVGWSTLADMLEHRANQHPERLAFVYEEESGHVNEFSYAKLDSRARAIAAWLAERTEPGDRVLLVYPPGLEFIAAFFGCVYAGVLPVPATYPKPRRPMPRLNSIVADCHPRLVLTHSSSLDGLALEGQSPAIRDLVWEPTDHLASSIGSGFQPVSRKSEDIAFLQYTSGSTSDPRGVMVSHENLLHNMQAIYGGFAVGEHGGPKDIPTGVFWLPAYHDMGLIGGILTPIFAGGTSYLLAPTTFLRRPLRWLELVSRVEADVSGAPNFGYKLVVEKTTPAERAELNLKSWRLAFCGAEPIHPETLNDFSAAFAEAGFNSSAFYPCYGLAEATLLATGGKGPSGPRILHVDRQELGSHRGVRLESTHPRAQALVGCGAALNDNLVKIVDPKTGVEREEGAVGEIWICGGSVALGYWNQDELNQEVFQASLPDNGSLNYLRTGDLGFYLDGELYVTGRLKDVIIIRGRNHYPHDIERTAQHAHEAVDMGAAFSVEGEREEQLVVVHQLRREHRKADKNEVLREIRKRIVDEHELDPHAILLIRPVSLPITSSGKVQRNACREQYLTGQLPVVGEWTNRSTNEEGNSERADVLAASTGFLENVGQEVSAELTGEIQGWLIAWLTERANLNPGTMTPTTPFAELGIDSLTAVEISQELDQILGLQLPPMVIWSHPDPEALASYLAEQLVASRSGAAVSD